MTLVFDIRFHTPFRVATGNAGDGGNSMVDPSSLLPASSLKGIMRWTAQHLLSISRTVVKEVFGEPHQASAWSWSDASIAQAADDIIRSRARIQISDDTGTVEKGALAIAEEVLATQASFAIRRRGFVPAGRADLHKDVLLASARAVTSLGGDRRRGLGWVSVTPTDPLWTPDLTKRLAGTISRVRNEGGTP